MYAEAARKAKFQGTVGLLITVNADGTVGDINVIRTLGLGLDEKAVEAVKQWKFIPGMKDLVRVPMQARVVVTFRLT
jgi:TonB family protein